MTSRTRRFAAIAAALALTIAACGGDDQADDTAAEETDTGATEPTDTGEGDTDTAGTGDTAETADTADTAEATDTAEPTDDAPPPARAERLTLGSIVIPASLQASQAQYGNANPYFQSLYDGLLRIEPDGVTVTPHLATDWSYSDDLTVLTMTLRDDVTFSDGTPFDADAAAQNLVRFRDSNGPEASTLSSMVDAVAIDPTTLEITLAQPDPAFLNYMAHTGGLMQSPSSFDAADADANPIGSGPYVLDTSRTVAEAEYVFTARDDYWAPETVHYDELVVRVISDPTATINAMLAGEINAATLVNRDSVGEVEAAGWDLHTQELNWVGFTLLDRDGSMGSPLDDVLVRQAINHSIDRQAILDAYANGFGEVTGQVFRPESAGFDPAFDEMYPYDPDRARELLAEAGFEDGFAISLPSSGIFGDALPAILGDQLADVGITVEWVLAPPGGYISEILAPNWPMYFMFLEQNPNDWQFINFLIAPTAVWNPNGYTDDTVAGLIEQIPTAPAGAERDALVAELGRHVAEQAWYAPTYRETAIFASDAATDVTSQAGNVVPYLWNIVPVG